MLIALESSFPFLFDGLNLFQQAFKRPAGGVLLQKTVMIKRLESARYPFDSTNALEERPWIPRNVVVNDLIGEGEIHPQNFTVLHYR